MELTWLKTFTDAAETLNFRKTSERLSLSQPSVTVHIRQLEESLGLKLFVREKNRVALTEEGEVFRVRAREILAAVEASVEEVHAYAQGYRKKWQLAITPLMAETVLPYLLKSFMRDYPEIELVIRVEESKGIERLVEAGDVDAGISALPPLGRRLLHETVYEDPLVFVVPRDAYDDESGPAIDPGQLLESAVLFTDHHPAVWEEMLPLLREGIKGLRTMQVTQAHIVKRFIEEGLGVSFLPKSIVRRELIEGRLLEVPFTLFSLPVARTYFLGRRMEGIETEFLRRLRSVYFK